MSEKNAGMQAPETEAMHLFRAASERAARLEARVETLENENVAIVESRDKLRARVEALEATDRWLALMAKECIEDRHRVPASAQREMVGYHCVFDQALNEKDACYDAACRRPHYIKAPTMPTTDYRKALEEIKTTLGHHVDNPDTCFECKAHHIAREALEEK